MAQGPKYLSHCLLIPRVCNQKQSWVWDGSRPRDILTTYHMPSTLILTQAISMDEQKLILAECNLPHKAVEDSPTTQALAIHVEHCFNLYVVSHLGSEPEIQR